MIGDKIRPDSEETRELAATVLRSGGLVICPTSTNYGILCDATNERAIGRIFAAKKRYKVAPLTVLLPDVVSIEKYTQIPEWFDKRTLAALLPGDVSFIFKQKFEFPLQLSCGLRTSAVICTKNKCLASISKLFGSPLGGSSANLSGQGEIRSSLQKAVEDLEGEVDLIIDGGKTEAEMADSSSTKGTSIVDCTFEVPYLCREGVISTELLREYMPNLVCDVQAYNLRLESRIRSLS